MLLFELKKIFSKTVKKIALMILAVILIALSVLAVNSIYYIDEDGNEITGISAAKKLRDDKNEWAGYITEDVLRKVIEENTAYITSEGYLSDDIQEQDKAYGKTLGYSDFSQMINYAFGESYTGYVYPAINSVTTEEVGELYERRILNLKERLDTGEETLTDAKKQYFIKQYEGLETPFYYEYYEGWETLAESSYTPTLMMILALVLGFLVSGIFSDEFQLKADSIFFSTELGRNKAVLSKVGAGFLVVTAIYWIVIILYSVIVLGALGFGGALCPIQISYWNYFYNINFFQEYVLTVLGGYVGTLFILTLSMLVSAATHSSIIAMSISFIFICVTPFLNNITSLSRITRLFPAELFSMWNCNLYFTLFQIGGYVINSIQILFVLYTVLSIILQPIMYQVYSKAKVK